ncbi:MAG: BatA domain-containing protein [Acidobacteriota bacterium]
MAFLSPLFLLGLAALAVPVLIHLIQRERKRVVEFPSLMFLRRIPYQSVRRRRIHHWALLLLRLAVLALVVTAFARPFFRSGALAAASGGAREVVVLVDRSYSMGHEGQWARVQSAARDEFARLGPGDRASLVAFAAGAELAVRSTGDRDRLAAAVGTLSPTAAATRFGPALKLAASIAAESELPVRELVLISDFQRAAWDPGDAVRLPERTSLRPVSIAPEGAVNLSIAPVTVQRGTFAGQERITLTTGVLNRSDQDLTRDVVLEIDGRPVQTATVQVAAFGSQAVQFEPVLVTKAHTRAVVRLPADALAADNAAYVVLSPPQPLAVTVLSAGSARSAGILHLSRALAIGDRPRFDATYQQGDGVAADLLDRARVVIVTDTAVSAAAAERLARFVEGGGGLLVALGRLGSVPGALLPGTPGPAVERVRGVPGTLGSLEFGHPVFEAFRQPRSGDFSTARFYGYRSLQLDPNLGASVLARFDDGSPALVERRHGQGRVLVWTSTLDLTWSDLPLKPVYLPFVHQLTRYLAAYRELPPSQTVGQVVDAADATATVTGDLVALTPTGARVPLASGAPPVISLDEPGFYEVRPQTAGAAPVLVAASNVELSEADPGRVDPDEIVTALGGAAGGAAGAAGAGVVVPDETQERTQRIWWYLLFAGILLLAGETVLSHRVSRVAR